ncbi:very short patch repair endonuclease [Dyella humicola]|uniref:very short patch repair endonuclease n=1 Tax=Dyella humicola TaxID=2992126 RepID=UPI00224F00EE|nr:DNA mismatch endonuclease Vsr [Dyella humicola]
MADVVDQVTRSRMMSGIRGKDTKPEWIVRRGLHAMGFRFRLHVRDLPGRPDLVLPRYNAVIFIHGCFWHGHNCRLFRWPASRPDFWREKIEGNRQRDVRALYDLDSTGWRIAVVWECALRSKGGGMESVIERLAAWLKSDSSSVEFKE